MTGAMDAVYKIGMLLGILSVYSFITWGLGAIFTCDEPDTLPAAIIAWITGAILFVLLAVYTLSLLGRWG